VLPTSSQTGSTANAALAEPKRIRTVTIRPDQPVGIDPELARAAALPAANSSPPASVPAPRAAPPQRAAPERVAAAPPQSAPPRAAPRDPNAPLSLTPDAVQSARPAPPPREPQAPAQVASVPPPTQLAPAPAPSAGGYTVQVSSQRSEQDAQAAFRGLQGKYPSVLQQYQPIIRRADLGAKGVYYRALVGPFASHEDANTVCSALKAAGGQCIIQRN
jgi:hypothetical protein